MSFRKIRLIKDRLEVAQALQDSPDHGDNVSDSFGVIENDAQTTMIIDDGNSMDLNDLLDRAVEKRLPSSLFR